VIFITQFWGGVVAVIRTRQQLHMSRKKSLALFADRALTSVPNRSV